MLYVLIVERYFIHQLCAWVLNASTSQRFTSRWPSGENSIWPTKPLYRLKHFPIPALVVYSTQLQQYTKIKRYLIPVCCCTMSTVIYRFFLRYPKHQNPLLIQVTPSEIPGFAQSFIMGRKSLFETSSFQFFCRLLTMYS